MTHLAPDCWNVTGTDGDRSCTRLAEMIHCGNCPTRSGMGRTLFDRVAPDEYLREWSAAPASGAGNAGWAVRKAM